MSNVNVPPANAFVAKVYGKDFGIFINLNVLPGQQEIRSVYKSNDQWTYLYSEIVEVNQIDTAKKADSAMINALLNINAHIESELSGGSGGDKPDSGIERIQWNIENSFFINNNLVDVKS